MPTWSLPAAVGGSTGSADDMSIVCAGSGAVSLVRDSLRTIGRVDGFTCISKVPLAGTVSDVSSTSVKRIERSQAVEPQSAWIHRRGRGQELLAQRDRDDPGPS